MKKRLTKECIDRWFKENPGVPLKLECDDGSFTKRFSSITVLSKEVDGDGYYAIFNSLDTIGFIKTLTGYPSPYQPKDRKLYAYRMDLIDSGYETSIEFYDTPLDSLTPETGGMWGSVYTRAPEYDIEYPSE